MYAASSYTDPNVYKFYDLFTIKCFRSVFKLLVFRIFPWLVFISYGNVSNDPSVVSRIFLDLMFIFKT
jgi:hypothetical protein